MTAYYNEIEPFAAQWLRNLIAAGHIAPGEVDERSIIDVRADDLRRYAQCHFFAGIGVWSHALRLAGWPDDRPVWTGSCPCQPFSTAGSQRGSDDERHLWPAFFRLIRECRPPVVLGEQVAGAAGLAWLDHVCADLEGAAYAVAAANLGAHSVGAPHIRQRLYWVAHRDGNVAYNASHRAVDPARDQPQQSARSGDALWVAHADDAERREIDVYRQDGCDGTDNRRKKAYGFARTRGEVCELADADHAGQQGLQRSGDVELHRGSQSVRPTAESSVPNFWSDIEWLPCRDGKYRPAKPGIFPLVARYPGPRVGILRAAGNAIVAPLAAEFIGAVMECQP